jgi:hypothetical protein
MDQVTLYAALTGEPFLLSLDEIGKLTDWQIEKLIVEPAVKKSKEFESGRTGATTLDGSKGLPTEDEFVAASVRMFGGTADQWRANYRTAMEEDQKNAGGG